MKIVPELFYMIELKGKHHIKNLLSNDVLALTRLH